MSLHTAWGVVRNGIRGFVLKIKSVSYISAMIQANSILTKKLLKKENRQNTPTMGI